MKKVFASIILLIVSAQAAAEKYPEGYAEDRAAIIDLQHRYVLAMDYFDADGYAAVFAENGVLDWAGGIVEGREARLCAACWTRWQPNRAGQTRSSLSTVIPRRPLRTG